MPTHIATCKNLNSFKSHDQGVCTDLSYGADLYIGDRIVAKSSKFVHAFLRHVLLSEHLEAKRLKIEREVIGLLLCRLSNNQCG